MGWPSEYLTSILHCDVVDSSDGYLFVVLARWVPEIPSDYSGQEDWTEKQRNDFPLKIILALPKDKQAVFSDEGCGMSTWELGKKGGWPTPPPASLNVWDWKEGQ